MDTTTPSPSVSNAPSTNVTPQACNARITATPPTASGTLGKLPKELREIIYGLLFPNGLGLSLMRTSKCLYADTVQGLRQTAVLQIRFMYHGSTFVRCIQGITWLCGREKQAVTNIQNLDIGFGPCTKDSPINCDFVISLNELVGHMDNPRRCHISFQDFDHARLADNAIVDLMKVLQRFAEISLEVCFPAPIRRDYELGTTEAQAYLEFDRTNIEMIIGIIRQLSELKPLHEVREGPNPSIFCSDVYLRAIKMSWRKETERDRIIVSEVYT